MFLIVESVPTTYPVFGDLPGKWARGVLQKVKEHVLLNVFVFLKEVPDLVGDWTSIVLDPKLDRPPPLVHSLHKVAVGAKLVV